MNITFIIGNGFDLNLGFHTGYGDFYKWYVGKDEYFARVIAKDLEEGIHTWADLELALGEYTNKLSENEMSVFMDEKESLDVSLSQYLEQEIGQHNMDYATISDKFRSCVFRFYEHFEEKYKLEYGNWVKSVISSIDYRFITLNYTDVLDKICNESLKILKPELSHRTHNGAIVNDRMNRPLFLHGQVGNGIILGVSDKDQIANEIFKNTNDCIDFFIKESINDRVGDRCVEKAKSIIDGSQYICVFGSSIGETDGRLWNYIARWLYGHPERRLVLFVRDLVCKPESAPNIARRKEYFKQMFLDRANVDSGQKSILNNRIIICMNKPLFNLK